MTVSRLRETRAMATGTWGGVGAQISLSDPAAIPPPGSFASIRAGVPVTAHTSMQIDVVFTCLRILSNAIIKLGDLRAYHDEYDQHSVPYKVWEPEQPAILGNTFGPYMMQYDGRRRTVCSMALFGEAFWYALESDSLGYPTAIEVLHPAFMKVEGDGTGRNSYVYGTGKDRKDLDPDRVTHIPMMALPGAARGLSAVDYAGVSFALALAAMEYGQRWFQQGASPSYLLSTDTKLGREEVERIAEKFMIDHAGLTQSHLPLVVDNGLKVQKIQSTPDEAQYIQTLNYARACIASWFGIPSHLVGGEADKGNVWGKTVQEQSMQFLQWTLSGYTVPLEEAHGLLIPKAQKAAFDTQALTAPDAAALAQEIMALRQTQVATQNDVRVRKLGMPPVDGGDNIVAPLASNTAPSATVPDHFSDTDAPSAPAAEPAQTPPNGPAKT